MSQYRSLRGRAGWRAIIFSRRLRIQSVCDFRAAVHAAYVVKTFPEHLIISTMKTKVAMARLEACQNQMVSATLITHIWGDNPPISVDGVSRDLSGARSDGDSKPRVRRLSVLS
jgi:hypothetical protein